VRTQTERLDGRQGARFWRIAHIDPAGGTKMMYAGRSKLKICTSTCDEYKRHSSDRSAAESRCQLAVGRHALNRTLKGHIRVDIPS
jgi:hypothetical protein